MKHEIKQYNRIASLKKRNDFEDIFPQIVEIHPTYACNSNCNYCFHKDNNIVVSEDLLDVRRYRKLFEEMRELKIFNLSISGGGEPTLYKNLPFLIKKAGKNCLSVRIVTNGNLLSEDILKSLEFVEEIRFSLDAVNAVTYSKIKNVPLKRFLKTMKNIERVMIFKKKNNLNLKIGVTFLINYDNYKEVRIFCVKMLKLGVDSVVIKSDIFGLFTLDNGKIEKIVKEIKNLKSKKIEFREIKAVIPEQIGCFIPYFKIAINPFGKVYSCCLAAQPGSSVGFELGDIKKNTLRSIWEKSAKMRKHVKREGIKCNFCNYTDYKINKLLN